MSDKRNFHRFKIWFPITLVVAKSEVWAICRDASSGGLLVSTEAPLAIGTKLVARFKVSPRARSGDRGVPASERVGESEGRSPSG